MTYLEFFALLQSYKKTHPTIKCLYKLYPQSLPALGCSNIPLKVRIWKKRPSKEMNQSTLESCLPWVQVSSVISSPLFSARSFV